MDYKSKDYTILLAGFLGALKLLLSSMGIDFITDDMVNASVDLVAFGVALFAVWKNTYVSKKAQIQKAELKRKNLIK